MVPLAKLPWRPHSNLPLVAGSALNVLAGEPMNRTRRTEVVLKAASLTQEDIVFSGQEKYRPAMDNALPPFIVATVIFSPIIVAELPLGIVTKLRQRSLLEHFDPYRVRLGLDVAEVEKMLGAPHLTEGLDDGSELRYYGSAKFGYYNDFFWLSVAFRDGKATAVFTHDFATNASS